MSIILFHLCQKIYIRFVIIPICNPHNQVCVYSKAQYSFFFLQQAILIGPSYSKLILSMLPGQKVFTPNIVLFKQLRFSLGIYNTSLHFWVKDMGQIVMLLRHILGKSCPTSLVEQNFHWTNFVPHHFQPRIFKSLASYLLVFMHLKAPFISRNGPL